MSVRVGVVMALVKKYDGKWCLVLWNGVACWKSRRVVDMIASLRNFDALYTTADLRRLSSRGVIELRGGYLLN